MVRSRFVLTAVLAALATPALAQRVELLDFYLPTCQPCHAMAPVVQRLAADGVSVRKIDGSREVALTRRLRVDSYPTFIVAVDGREAARVVGMTSYEDLRGLIARAAPQRPAGTQLASAPRTFTPTSAEGRAFAVGSDLGPGSPAPPATRAAGNADDGRLVSSSVRLTVEDPAGRAYGTGTVVDAREGEALVVTCAHLFRDANGRPISTEGRLSVELFSVDASGPHVTQRVQGQLVSHDFDADVALVAIRPTGSVMVARVAASPGDIRREDAVRSVGCDLGADPSVRHSRVVDLNRYLGPPNIETTGAPIQGRSGGGLFNAAGELIGVCFASDEEADEGLYSGLASIHAQLDRVGMSALYRGAAPEPAAIAQAPPSMPAVSSPTAEPELVPVVRGQGAPEAPPLSNGTGAPFGDQPGLASTATGLVPVERAALEEVVSRGVDSEVVLLIRPRTPGAATEVMTLDSASPAFVSALRDMREESKTLGGPGVARR